MGCRVFFWIWSETGEQFRGGISQECLWSFCWNGCGSLVKIAKDKRCINSRIYTHACVSTTAREAMMMDFEVFIDYDGTGSCNITHEFLGALTADEVRNSA